MSDATNAPLRTLRHFLIIWLGQVISVIGSGLTAFGLAVWIFDQTGAATPFALTVLFGSLPRILLAPVAGVVADRWNRRRIMIASDSGSALVTVAALLLLRADALAIWHIYFIAAVGSTLGAFQQPAYAASVTMLVPKKQLDRANGLLQMGQALEMLFAPLLAGAVFAFVGLNGIFLLDFVTFFFAIGALLLIPIPQPPAEARRSDARAVTAFWHDAIFGWRYLRARSGLFGLLLFFALVNFFLNFAAVLLGPMILTFESAATLGLIQTLGGVGMLVGSIGMSAWGGFRRRVSTIISSILLAAVGLVFAGLSPSIATIAAGFVLLMFTIPFGSASSRAIFQSKVEPGVQGRVFAIRGMISQSMMPVAFLIAGPLADRIFEPLMRVDGPMTGTWIGQLLGTGPGRGTALLFVLSGSCLLVATLLVAANPRIRNLEDELPDVLPEDGEVDGGAAIAAPAGSPPKSS